MTWQSEFDPPPPAPERLFEIVEQGPDAVVPALLHWLHEHGAPDVRIVEPESAVALAEGVRAAGIGFGARGSGRIESARMSPEHLAGWAGVVHACLAAAQRWRDLTELAYTDDLTGAGNRRDFARYLRWAMEVAALRQQPLALMVFDIDDFKSYNDRFGHAAGDEVLRQAVKLLAAVIRRGDRVFRIGGDEFVVVFGDPTTPRESGSRPVESVDQIASRFALRVRDLHLPALGEGALAPLSISAGVAMYPDDGHDAATLVAAADRRAMLSKQRGKGLITFGPRFGADEAI